MAHYTTLVRSIVEEHAQFNPDFQTPDFSDTFGYWGKGEFMDSSYGLDQIDKLIEYARPHIFSFEYPLFDPAYRKQLETKIINHYFTEEIGFETVGLWRLNLRNRMREIMPYYNQLYQSELLPIEPLNTVNVTTTYSKTGKKLIDGKVDESFTKSTETTEDLTEKDTTGHVRELEQQDQRNATTTNDLTTVTNSNTRGTNHSNTLNSELPQTQYAGHDYGSTQSTTDGTTTQAFDENVRNTGTVNLKQTDDKNINEKIDRVEDKQNDNQIDVGEEGKSDRVEDTKINTVEEYLLHKVGFEQNQVQFLERYRKNLLNIDQMIIDDLKCLFMQIY